MTPACMTTPPLAETNSLRRTCRRRGGDKPACGQLLRHLTTGFGQPYGVRWTPPGCPLAPPPTTTTAACLQVPINHNQSKETRPQDLTPSPSRRAGTGEHRQPPNRWAIPEYRSGPYRLVKSTW